MHAKEWLLNPLAQQFLQHFGVEADPLGDLETFLEATKKRDTRPVGAPRLIAESITTNIWSAEESQLIMAVAEIAGMLKGETPLPAGSYCLGMALGGLRRAPLDRLEYLIQQVNNGASCLEYAIVGSTRLVGAAERSVTDTYALGAETEYDLCLGAMASVLLSYPGLQIQPIRVDNPKASTPDVIAAVLNRYTQTEGLLFLFGESVAVSTTQIYTGYTPWDARRAADPFRVAQVSVIGHPSDPAMVAKRTMATYYQEVIRWLQALARAYAAGF